MPYLSYQARRVVTCTQEEREDRVRVTFQLECGHELQVDARAAKYAAASRILERRLYRARKKAARMVQAKAMQCPACGPAPKEVPHG